MDPQLSLEFNADHQFRMVLVDNRRKDRNTIRRLRAALKRLFRDYGFRCVRLEPAIEGLDDEAPEVHVSAIAGST